MLIYYEMMEKMSDYNRLELMASFDLAESLEAICQFVELPLSMVHKLFGRFCQLSDFLKPLCEFMMSKHTLPRGTMVIKENELTNTLFKPRSSVVLLPEYSTEIDSILRLLHSKCTEYASLIYYYLSLENNTSFFAYCEQLLR